MPSSVLEKGEENVTIRMRRTALWLGVVLLASAGCGNDTATLTKDPPDLDALSPLTVGFGDTLTITGSGFNAELAANRIVLSSGRFDDPASRRVVVPFAGSRTELRGVVPDGAFTGNARVEDTEPLSGLPLAVPQPQLPSNAMPLGVRLSAGEVGKAFFSGTGYDFSAAAGPSGADYLVVLFSDAAPPAASWTYTYHIAAVGSAALMAGETAAPDRGYAAAVEAPSRNAGVAPAPLLPDGPRKRELDRRIDEQLRELLGRPGGSSGEPRTAPRPSVEAGTPAATAQFKVLRDVSANLADPASYVIVTADLKFEGAHTLLYVDVNTPAADLTQGEAEALGLAFDDGIYDANRIAFGSESDINGDGKVAVLMSPVVNGLTDPGSASTRGFIAGYFLPNDLLPALVPAGATNAMEIFYSIVPDPAGQWGNVFPKDKVLPIIEGVLAHEFFHMIIFNYRVLIYGRGVSGDYIEDLWLDEGLAHIAEDVNGYDGSNVARANLFLADPGNVTLIHGGDDLEERGASFLFLRLLGDRYGDAIFRSLVQTKRIGTANVEAASGAVFKELFADWTAALYLSGRGITDDPRFNYTSIDILADFRPPYVAPGSVSPAGIDGFVKAMAPEYILYAVPASSAIDFSIGGDPTGRFNAVVIRLR
ncbi:MAG: hypothetical protein C4574_06420 [Candidatus Latescibacterota bacterium]|nr:MAG: hypothetical protein C4574_06420 [Candidatus Latescibacterota bacterium]